MLQGSDAELAQPISAINSAQSQQPSIDQRSRVRVLHVVPQLRMGGIEQWVRDIAKRKNTAIEMDVAVGSSGVISEFAQEIKAQGVGLHICGTLAKPFHFAMALHGLLNCQRNYDVIHSHLHRLNGLVCFVAALHGIPVRVAHSHSDYAPHQNQRSPIRSLFPWGGEMLQKTFATSFLACSKTAGDALFRKVRDFEILYCGIDTERFRHCRPGNDVRKELGISKNSLVVGHVGRGHFQKNYDFFLRVAEQIIVRNPSAHFVLAGDKRTAEWFTNTEFRDRVHILGKRHDIPDLLSIMNVFLFPSLCEGLPLTLLEAQASGVPCVYSDNITAEVEVYPPLMYRTSLSETPAYWAEKVERAAQNRQQSDRENGLTAVASGPFNIEQSVAKLEHHYWSGLLKENSVSSRIRSF